MHMFQGSGVQQPIIRYGSMGSGDEAYRSLAFITNGTSVAVVGRNSCLCNDGGEHVKLMHFLMGKTMRGGLLGK